MDITEGIVQLDNIISPVFCEKIISLIDKKAKKRMGVRNKTLNSARNVKGYTLNFETPTNLFYWNYIRKEIERLYSHYKFKFPMMESNRINQIDLLKYSIGGKYDVHTDHYTTTPRHLSVIMNLNEDYDGGDLIFTDQKLLEIKRLKLKKGSIVFFPSNFLYPHAIEPITKGIRYSIVSWLQ